VRRLLKPEGRAEREVGRVVSRPANGPVLEVPEGAHGWRRERGRVYIAGSVRLDRVHTENDVRPVRGKRRPAREI
jgi:hypothetical protein